MKKIKKPKIGIVGWFGFGNAGDEAMRDILLKEFPGAVASHRSTIEKCDVYIMAGGQMIQTFTGVYMLDFWLSTRDEPCYALSLGAHKGWQKESYKVKRCFSRFRKVFVRDEITHKELSKVVKVDGIMPDLVLLADQPASKKTYPILFNYSDEKTVDPKNQYRDIIAKGGTLPIAVMPKDVGVYADKYVTYQELISMAKSAKGLIGTRLHSLVLGAIAGIPMAGIAYSDKTKRFCERYQIPCFPYGKSCATEIFKSLRKPKIDLARERSEIRKIIKIIKNDIKKQFS
ncbi:MAG: polysaccharide pyruvyl transferase family protein [Magnetococcus sp. WYHC-3]